LILDRSASWQQCSSTRRICVQPARQTIFTSA
jgi:hypothetical protein